MNWWSHIIITQVTNGYSYPVHANLGDLERNTDSLAQWINKTYRGQSVALVGRGTSGVLIATRTAQKLQNVPHQVTLIRKPGENAHGGTYRIWDDPKIIIVDDLISSGETLRAIREHLEQAGNLKQVEAICIGGISPAHLHEEMFPNLKYLLS